MRAGAVLALVLSAVILWVGRTRARHNAHNSYSVVEQRGYLTWASLFEGLIVFEVVVLLWWFL